MGGTDKLRVLAQGRGFLSLWIYIRGCFVCIHDRSCGCFGTHGVEKFARAWGASQWTSNCEYKLCTRDLIIYFKYQMSYNWFAHAVRISCWLQSILRNWGFYINHILAFRITDHYFFSPHTVHKKGWTRNPNGFYLLSIIYNLFRFINKPNFTGFLKIHPLCGR